MSSALPPLVPLPQDDGPEPVVAIEYETDARLAFDFLRAVVAAKETNERALKVTETAIQYNPANYGAWYWRRRCLDALGQDPEIELAFLSRITEENPKNYQIWHHRRILIQKCGRCEEERAFTEMVLADDSKNYHAWAHRQWAVKAFSLWTDELDFVDRLLMRDVFNNSAWNYRWFVISNTTGWDGDVPLRELKYALNRVFLALENPSPWNYARGVAKRLSAEVLAAGIVPLLVPLSTVHPDCVELVSFKAFTANLLGQRALEHDLYAQLTELDSVRAHYWKHLQSSIQVVVQLETTD